MIIIEASQLTSDEYRTGCKVVNLRRSWYCDSFKIAIHEVILEPESSIIAAIILLFLKSRGVYINQVVSCTEMLLYGVGRQTKAQEEGQVVVFVINSCFHRVATHRCMVCQPCGRSRVRNPPVESGLRALK